MAKTGAASAVEAPNAANGDDPTKHAKIETADAKNEQKENGLMELENQKKDGTEVRKGDDTKMEDVKYGALGDRKKGLQEENEKEADIMDKSQDAKVEQKRANEQQPERAREVNDMDSEDKKASGEKIEIVGKLEGVNIAGVGSESEAKKEHSKEVEEWKKVEDGKGSKSEGDVEKERGGTEPGKINQEKDPDGERKECEDQKAEGVEHKEKVAGEAEDAKEIEHTREEGDAEKKIRHKERELKERKDVKEKKKEKDIGLEKKIEEEKEIDEDVDKQGKETGDTGKEEKATEKEFDKEGKEVREEVNKEEMDVEEEAEREGEEDVEKEEQEREDTGKEEKTTEKELEEEEKEASQDIKKEEQETKEDINEEEKHVEKETEKEDKEMDDEIEKEEEETEGEIEKEEDKTEKNGRKRKWYGEKGEVDENKERKKAKELSSPPHFSIDRPQRERKTVERLVEVIEKGSEKSFRIEKGRGTPLKDIPNVAYKLSKRKPDDIKLLHNLLFGRKGKAVDFKNHISQFSGFVWHGNEDKEREKVREKLDRCVKERLLDFCDVFDIPVSKAAARKEDLVNKLLDFMITPHATSEVLLAEKEQDSSRKRKRGPRGSASRSGGSFGKRSRKRLAKGEDTPKSARKNVSETESDDDDEHKEDTDTDKHDEPEDVKHSDSEQHKESVKYEGSDDERDEATEKSIDEKMSSKRKSSSGRGKSKKVTTPTKSTPASAKSTKASSSSSSKQTKDEKKINDSSEKVFSRKKKVNEVPKKSIPKSASKMENSGGKEGRGKAKTTKAKDSGPSKEELRERICEILEEVDFSTATFTDILKLLAGHFKTDLTARKTSIKLMIQEELRKLADADDDNEDDEDEGDAGKDEKQPTSREIEA